MKEGHIFEVERSPRSVVFVGIVRAGATAALDKAVEIALAGAAVRIGQTMDLRARVRIELLQIGRDCAQASVARREGRAAGRTEDVLGVIGLAREVGEQADGDATVDGVHEDCGRVSKCREQCRTHRQIRRGRGSDTRRDPRA